MDYESVVEFMRLNNGLPWTIPITLAVKEGESEKYEIGKEIALFSEAGEPLAVLSLEENSNRIKEKEAGRFTRRKETAHPGVAAIMAQGEVLSRGKVSVVNRVKYNDFLDYRKRSSRASGNL